MSLNDPAFYGERHAGKTISFFCKDRVCFYEKNGVRVALTRKRQGAVAVCENPEGVDALLSPNGVPEGCPVPATFGVLDFLENGTHFVFIGDDGRIRVTTGAAMTGDRPWSPRYRQRNKEVFFGKSVNINGSITLLRDP